MDSNRIHATHCPFCGSTDPRITNGWPVCPNDDFHEENKPRMDWSTRLGWILFGGLVVFAIANFVCVVALLITHPDGLRFLLNLGVGSVNAIQAACLLPVLRDRSEQR